MGNCNHKRTETLRVIHQTDSSLFRITITEDKCLKCGKIIRYESKKGIISGYLYHEKRLKNSEIY